MSTLPEARESLSYWEERLQRLPRRARRERREAREMVARWQARVSDAERAQYGAGVKGAALMLLAERRLPTDTRAATQQVARVASRMAVATIALAALTTVAIVALVIVLLVALL